MWSSRVVVGETLTVSAAPTACPSTCVCGHCPPLPVLLPALVEEGCSSSAALWAWLPSGTAHGECSQPALVLHTLGSWKGPVLKCLLHPCSIPPHAQEHRGCRRQAGAGTEAHLYSKLSPLLPVALLVKIVKGLPLRTAMQYCSRNKWEPALAVFGTMIALGFVFPLLKRKLLTSFRRGEAGSAM